MTEADIITDLFNGVKILVDAEIKHRAKKKETEDIENQTGNSTAEQKVEPRRHRSARVTAAVFVIWCVDGKC